MHGGERGGGQKDLRCLANGDFLKGKFPVRLQDSKNSVRRPAGSSARSVIY